jgi:hypothetical protein
VWGSAFASSAFFQASDPSWAEVWPLGIHSPLGAGHATMSPAQGNVHDSASGPRRTKGDKRTLYQIQAELRLALCRRGEARHSLGHVLVCSDMDKPNIARSGGTHSQKAAASAARPVFPPLSFPPAWSGSRFHPGVRPSPHQD